MCAVDLHDDDVSTRHLGASKAYCSISLRACLEQEHDFVIVKVELESKIFVDPYSLERSSQIGSGSRQINFHLKRTKSIFMIVNCFFELLCHSPDHVYCASSGKHEVLLIPRVEFSLDLH